MITEMSEVIVPDPYDVNLPGGGTFRVTGARVQFDQARPTSMTLLQAGLFPTFYQFTESIIEVKMSISQKTASSSELEVGASLEVVRRLLRRVRHVRFACQLQNVEHLLLLGRGLEPAPHDSEACAAAARLTPRIVTVNTLAQPPVVS